LSFGDYNKTAILIIARAEDSTLVWYSSFRSLMLSFDPPAALVKPFAPALGQQPTPPRNPGPLAALRRRDHCDWRRESSDRRRDRGNQGP
jgi:hypothetical protein